MTGDVDAGDLVLVPLGKGEDILLGLVLRDRKRGVDIDFVGVGNLVEHHLKCVQIRQRLAAGEDEVAVGRDGVHPLDAPADLLQGKPCHIRILAFIDAEGAVVLAVVRDKDRHRGAALPRLIGMFHIDRPFRVKWKIREKMVSKNRVEGLADNVIF